MRKRLFLKPILAIVDFSIMAIAFQQAYRIRFTIPFLPEAPLPTFDLYFQFSFLVALVGYSMLHSSGLYRLRRLTFTVEDFFAILRAVTFTALIIMAMNFILRGYIAGYGLETYSRLIILISWLLSLVFLTVWRLGASLLFKQFRHGGRGLRNVVIVGVNESAQRFYQAILTNVDFEYRPLGFVYNNNESLQGIDRDLPVLGAIEALPGIIQSQAVDEVILARIDVDNEGLAQLIKVCERADVQFSMIPGFFQILTRQMSVLEVADIPIFQLEDRIFQKWGQWLKRGMDIAFSLVALLVCLPLFVFVAIGIKVSSQGNMLFKQERVGKGEKLFLMYKFRSMYSDAEMKRSELEEDNPSSDPLLRLPADKRVTPIGRLLRRLSIDELPQLFNVLKGEMSLVGPRPHIHSEVANYKEWHKRKFDVLPGITGLTQVKGRKDLTLDEMIRLDIYYIENWSPWLDMQILLKTIPAIFTGRGAY